MRHRLKRKVFDGEDSCQKTRTLPTFTINSDGNPHSARKMLHSKSTYFYRWGSRLNYAVPGVCGLALLVGWMIAINPVLNSVEKVSAEGEPAAQADTAPTVSLELTQGAASQQTPTNVGEVTYRSNVFKVSGSGMVQYMVALNTASGETGDLKGRANPYATVGKVEPGTAVAKFKDNTWGYAISARNSTGVANSDLVYNPVPSGTSEVGNKVIIANRGAIATTAQINDSYKLTFAAKLASDLPSDHYEADVYLSLVASAGAMAEFGFTGGDKTITNMQDMTSTICSNAPVGQTGRLYDTRDGKDYWVTKLADNNCWMTQNLDYDVPGITKITNLKEWSLSTNNDGGILSQSTRAYYDPGEYIYVGPNSDHSRGTNCSTSVGLIECGQFSEVTPSNGSHYDVGNYYTWSAATAGTGNGMTSGDAPGSICPNNWRLPVSGQNVGEFKALLSQYGWTAITSGTADTMNDERGIYGDPLYFVYGGSLSSGRINNAGSEGTYWSSTLNATYTDYSYNLGFSSSVDPFNHGSGHRFVGRSVRCLAK